MAMTTKTPDLSSTTMAFASPLLSKSKKLPAGQTLLILEDAIPVQFFFPKEVVLFALKRDEMLKGIYSWRLRSNLR